MKLDNIHYNLNKLLSYNKPFNFVISAREAGKTTAVFHYCYNQLIKKGRTTIILRRLINDISQTYIDDIANVINKFLDKPIYLRYRKGSIKDGVVSVNVATSEDDYEGKPFIRIIALSNPISRIKSLMFPDLGTLVFDEFICNTRLGERYLDNEAFRFKELYNTYQRECPQGLRCIFMGNPYSLFNPYFAWQNVPTEKVYPGSFYTNEMSAIECYQITEELKAFILARNPLYQFDDSYKAYAFDGRNVNDEQIQITPKLPQNYSLRFVFYINGNKLCVYRNNEYDSEKWFYVQIEPNYQTTRRDIMTVDIDSLVDGTTLLSAKDRMQYITFKNAFRARKVQYKSLNEGYLTEELYQYI